MSTRLNLGSGRKNLEGYTNIDFGPPADVFLDLRGGLYHRDNTVDEIYAKHVIEHFTFDEWNVVLKDWVRVLKSGGKLIIECPDLIKCCEALAFDKYGERDFWYITIYGNHLNGGVHKQGFTIPRIHRELTEAGLKVTRCRNWGDDVHRIRHYNIRIEAVK